MPTEIFWNLPEKKRNRILDIAIKEFSEHPYDVASISEVVRKAGISKGSFYNYFGNKKMLYQYLVKLGTEEKLTCLKDLPSPESNAQLFDYLRWQFLGAVYFQIKNPRHARIAYRAFIDEIPFPDMTDELRRRGTTQFFKQLISQGLLHGDVAVWIDSDIAAFVLESIYYQFGKYIIQRLELTEADFINNSVQDNAEVLQVLDNLMDVLEAGIKRNPKQRLGF